MALVRVGACTMAFATSGFTEISLFSGWPLGTWPVVRGAGRQTVVQAHLLARSNPGVDTNPIALGPGHLLKDARAGSKVPVRVLSIYAAFNGGAVRDSSHETSQFRRGDSAVAGLLHVCLPQHEEYHINTITHLRNTMLHLEPHIYFQKE